MLAALDDSSGYVTGAVILALSDRKPERKIIFVLKLALHNAIGIPPVEESEYEPHQDAKSSLKALGINVEGARALLEATLFEDIWCHPSAPLELILQTSFAQLYYWDEETLEPAELDSLDFCSFFAQLLTIELKELVTQLVQVIKEILLFIDNKALASLYYSRVLTVLTFTKDEEYLEEILRRWKQNSIEEFLEKAKDGTLEEAERNNP